MRKMSAKNALPSLELDGSENINFVRYKEKMLLIGVLKDDYHKAVLSLLPEMNSNNQALKENIKKNRTA